MDKDIIYCVEDDDNIRELIVYTLENTGFASRGFEDGKTFKNAIKNNMPGGKPDLILLDVMMPGEDGIAVLKSLKKNEETADIPVIMVTAKGDEYDKVKALDLGADDYVTKPFGMMELVSRIKAVLRRVRKEKGGKNDSGDSEILKCGDLVMKLQYHQVFMDGREINLTLKEFNLLRLLMKNENIVLTRDRILETIWGYEFDGETRTVDVHVRSLREKLGEAGSYIETVRGVGYRLKVEN